MNTSTRWQHAYYCTSSSKAKAPVQAAPAPCMRYPHKGLRQHASDLCETLEGVQALLWAGHLRRTGCHSRPLSIYSRCRPCNKRMVGIYMACPGAKGGAEGLSSTVGTVGAPVRTVRPKHSRGCSGTAGPVQRA